MAAAHRWDHIPGPSANGGAERPAPAVRPASLDARRRAPRVRRSRGGVGDGAPHCPRAQRYPGAARDRLDYRRSPRRSGRPHDACAKHEVDGRLDFAGSGVRSQHRRAPMRRLDGEQIVIRIFIGESGRGRASHAAGACWARLRVTGVGMDFRRTPHITAVIYKLFRDPRARDPAEVIPVDECVCDARGMAPSTAPRHPVDRSRRAPRARSLGAQRRHARGVRPVARLGPAAVRRGSASSLERARISCTASHETRDMCAIQARRWIHGDKGPNNLRAVPGPMARPVAGPRVA